MPPVIELRGVAKRYRMGDSEVHALRGIDIEIQLGEFVSIVGPSGSGKSTLMHILGCLDVPTEGDYRMEGVEVHKMKEDELAAIRGRRIGFVFQQFNLIPRASALENVALPLYYQRKRDALARARMHLEAVGLGQRSGHFPNQLSGGEMQRVAIARAIATDPAIVLADEPTGNLDSKTGEEILRIFDRLCAEGRTLILVTHDPGVAARARRTIRLKDGRVVDGPSNGAA